MKRNRDLISRADLLEKIDGIWDCCDMIFEPEDHCCEDYDCKGCKWLETKNAIRRIIVDMPSARKKSKFLR